MKGPMREILSPKTRSILIAAAAVSVCAFPVVAQTTGDSVFRAPSVASGTGIADGAKIQGQLTTIFSYENKFAGSMFDIDPEVSLRITALDINCDPLGATAEINVWFRNGTSSGHEDSSDGWERLATGTGTCAGADQPTFISLPDADVTFSPGNTWGIYVNVGNYPDINLLYTNGSDLYFNDDLRLTSNCGKGNPAFTGETFIPRIWNGTLYYQKTWGSAYGKLFGNQSDLFVLRQLRDQHLAASDVGQALVDALYDNSSDALATLLDDPVLVEQARSLIAENMDAINAVLEGKEGVIEDTRAIVAFLDDYAANAPPRLRLLVKAVAKTMTMAKATGKTYFGFVLE